MFDASTVAAITNSTNIVQIVAEGCILAAILAVLLKRQVTAETRAGIIAWGEMSLGWMLHRCWWFWGVHMAPHNGTYAAWAIEYRWLLVVPTFLIAAGAARVISIMLGGAETYWILLPALTIGVFMGALALSDLPLLVLLMGTGIISAVFMRGMSE